LPISCLSRPKRLRSSRPIPSSCKNALKAIKPPTPDNELSSGPCRRRRASARRTRFCFFCHSCPGALLPPSLPRRTFWVPEAPGICCLINREEQATRALNSRSSRNFSRASASLRLRDGAKFRLNPGHSRPTSVSYGGRALTEAEFIHGGNENRSYVGIWLLTECDVAAATNSTLTVTMP